MLTVGLLVKQIWGHINRTLLFPNLSDGNLMKKMIIQYHNSNVNSALDLLHQRIKIVSNAQSISQWRSLEISSFCCTNCVWSPKILLLLSRLTAQYRTEYPFIQTNISLKQLGQVPCSRVQWQYHLGIWTRSPLNFCSLLLSSFNNFSRTFCVWLHSNSWLEGFPTTYFFFILWRLIVYPIHHIEGNISLLHAFICKCLISLGAA